MVGNLRIRYSAPAAGRGHRSMRRRASSRLSALQIPWQQARFAATSARPKPCPESGEASSPPNLGKWARPKSAVSSPLQTERAVEPVAAAPSSSAQRHEPAHRRSHAEMAGASSSKTPWPPQASNSFRSIHDHSALERPGPSSIEPPQPVPQKGNDRVNYLQPGLLPSGSRLAGAERKITASMPPQDKWSMPAVTSDKALPPLDPLTTWFVMAKRKSKGQPSPSAQNLPNLSKWSNAVEASSRDRPSKDFATNRLATDPPLATPLDPLETGATDAMLSLRERSVTSLSQKVVPGSRAQERPPHTSSLESSKLRTGANVLPDPSPGPSEMVEVHRPVDKSAPGKWAKPVSPPPSRDMFTPCKPPLLPPQSQTVIRDWLETVRSSSPLRAAAFPSTIDSPTESPPLAETPHVIKPRTPTTSSESPESRRLETDASLAGDSCSATVQPDLLPPHSQDIIKNWFAGLRSSSSVRVDASSSTLDNPLPVAESPPIVLEPQVQAASSDSLESSRPRTDASPAAELALRHSQDTLENRFASARSPSLDQAAASPSAIDIVSPVSESLPIAETPVRVVPLSSLPPQNSRVNEKSTSSPDPLVTPSVVEHLADAHPSSNTPPPSILAGLSSLAQPSEYLQTSDPETDYFTLEDWITTVMPSQPVQLVASKSSSDGTPISVAEEPFHTVPPESRKLQNAPDVSSTPSPDPTAVPSTATMSLSQAHSRIQIHTPGATYSQYETNLPPPPSRDAPESPIKTNQLPEKAKPGAFLSVLDRMMHATEPPPLAPHQGSSLQKVMTGAPSWPSPDRISMPSVAVDSLFQAHPTAQVPTTTILSGSTESSSLLSKDVTLRGPADLRSPPLHDTPENLITSIKSSLVQPAASSSILERMQSDGGLLPLAPHRGSPALRTVIDVPSMPSAHRMNMSSADSLPEAHPPAHIPVPNIGAEILTLDLHPEGESSAKTKADIAPPPLADAPEHLTTSIESSPVQPAAHPSLLDRWSHFMKSKPHSIHSGFLAVRTEVDGPSSPSREPITMLSAVAESLSQTPPLVHKPAVGKWARSPKTTSPSPLNRLPSGAESQSSASPSQYKHLTPGTSQAMQKTMTPVHDGSRQSRSRKRPAFEKKLPPTHPFPKMVRPDKERPTHLERGNEYPTIKPHQSILVDGEPEPPMPGRLDQVSDAVARDDISRPAEDARDMSRRSRREQFKLRGSLLLSEEKVIPRETKVSQASPRPAAAKPKIKKVVAKVLDVYIPSTVSVGQLAKLLNVRLDDLQQTMQQAGMANESSYDYVLTADYACLLAEEFNRNPIVSDEAMFDLFAPPPHPEPSTLPHRPPIITVMGHVDHGKTTLLDTLRSASVAKGEAGGITQHIGAFSVPVAKGVGGTDAAKAITFLDTPGHAAFSAMRARGAKVTDIIVLVVAADDGVMPQTREVIELVKKDQVAVVVAVNKIDKPGANVNHVYDSLMKEGIQVEALGGDVPAVEISGLTGQGLPELIETLSVMAEMQDLRSECVGHAQGYILESKLHKGLGPVATVLILRGCLKPGSHIIAGLAQAKVRIMTDSGGASVKVAHPGMAVTVSGWKDLPKAGDEVLEGTESDVKKALTNRRRKIEHEASLKDADILNQQRQQEREEKLKEAQQAQGTAPDPSQPECEGPKELRLVIKGDVSGSVEAVVGALEGIRTKDVVVKVITTGVGDVAESDVMMAKAANAMVVAFSVKTPRVVQTAAAQNHVPIYSSSIIYQIMDEIRSRVIALLPMTIEKKVTGEATVLQIFHIQTKAKKQKKVAGCRVTNGLVEKSRTARVVRNGEIVHEGTLDTLRHLKKDITEARKGLECGMGFSSFDDLLEGDLIQFLDVIEKSGTL